jgi:hypothetical protein
LINEYNTVAESLGVGSHSYTVQNPRGTFLLRDKPDLLNCFSKDVRQEYLIDNGEQITLVLFAHLQSTPIVTLHFPDKYCIALFINVLRDRYI